MTKSAMWHNRLMPNEQPWTKLKSSIYAALYRHPKSTKVTLRHVQLTTNDRLLDIGCGPGAAVRHAADQVATATGVDASGPMIAIARQRSAAVANTDFVVSPAEDLTLGDEAFSIVWTIQSWHHWNDPAAAFSEIRRVLSPGGRFLIVEKETTGVHGITRAGADLLADQLTTAGFVDASSERVDKMIIVSAPRP